MDFFSQRFFNALLLHLAANYSSGVGRGARGAQVSPVFCKGGRAPLPIIEKFCMALTEPTALLALQRTGMGKEC